MIRIVTIENQSRTTGGRQQGLANRRGARVGAGLFALVATLFVGLIPIDARALTVSVEDGEIAEGFFVPSFSYLSISRTAVGTMIDRERPIVLDCPGACLERAFSVQDGAAVATGHHRIQPVLALGGVEIETTIDIILPAGGFSDDQIASHLSDIHFSVDEAARIELYIDLTLIAEGSTSPSITGNRFRVTLEARDDPFGFRRVSSSLRDAGTFQISALQSQSIVGDIILIPGSAYALETSIVARQHFGGAEGTTSRLFGKIGLRILPIPEPATAVLIGMGLVGFSTFGSSRRG